MLQRILGAVLRPFDLAGVFLDRFWRGFKDFAKQVLLLKVVFLLILVITGTYHYLSVALSFLDRALDRVETGVIFVASLAMTGFVFLDFVDRESDAVNLGIDGGTRIALFLMLLMAFLGASLATRDGRHLTIDAADRVLTPGGSRMLFRLTMAISAVFTWKLYGAAKEVVSGHFEREFLAKLNVPEWFTDLANRVSAWFLDNVVTIQLATEDAEWFEEIREAGFAVDAGQNALKLWVPELVLPIAFLFMSLRFAGKFFVGPRTDLEADDIPARYARRNPGTSRKLDTWFAGLLPGLVIGLLLGLWFSQAWLIVICTFLLMLIGAPLFVVIGIAATLCVLLLEEGNKDITFVVKEMFKATDKEVLLAIPLFVIAGGIMTEGSISRRLIDMAKAAIGWFPGGLAISGVLSCIVFAAISGSSPVTVIAIGSIMVPALLSAGYPERFSLGLLTSAGSLGILIPPSIPMIIYAVVCFSAVSVGDPGIAPPGVDPLLLEGKSLFTGERPSVNDLFIAGILPGMLIGLILAFWAMFKARDKVMPVEETIHKLPEALLRGAWAAGLPILIIAGIYTGWFTATEAAAVSVVYALAVEFAIHPTIKKWNHRRGKHLDEPVFDLPVRELPRVFRDSAVVMGSLLLIVVLAIAFNGYLVFEKVPDRAAEWVASHVDSKIGFLIMVNIFLLILGCLMDILSAILIVAPLLAPIAVRQYGIDPIHFGIIFIVNLEIGYLTPPLGLNIFVASSVFDQPILKVIRSVIPFTLLLLVALMVVTWWPGLVGFLLTP